MPTTKNIETQMVSAGDQISQKNSTSTFTWESHAGIEFHNYERY